MSRNSLLYGIKICPRSKGRVADQLVGDIIYLCLITAYILFWPMRTYGKQTARTTPQGEWPLWETPIRVLHPWTARIAVIVSRHPHNVQTKLVPDHIHSIGILHGCHRAQVPHAAGFHLQVFQLLHLLKSTPFSHYSGVLLVGGYWADPLTEMALQRRELQRGQRRDLVGIQFWVIVGLGGWKVWS